MPTDERERYVAAWQGNPQQAIGTCGLETQAAFITPEDFTYGRFSDADVAAG